MGSLLLRRGQVVTGYDLCIIHPIYCIIHPIHYSATCVNLSCVSVCVCMCVSAFLNCSF